MIPEAHKTQRSENEKPILTSFAFSDWAKRSMTESQIQVIYLYWMRIHYI